MKPGRIARSFRTNRIGFIAPEDGSEPVFFQLNAICNREAISPAAGMVVEFRPAMNKRGPCAYHVHVLEPGEAQ